MSRGERPPSQRGFLAVLDSLWPTWALQALDHPGLWEWQVRLYERNDRRSTPPSEGILFTGSSSINLWSSLAQDMAPLPVLNRGFGGAHLQHVSQYADRIVLPYRPRLIVLYGGENDLSGWSGKTPESVAADFDEFAGIVHISLPGTRLLFLSIKPSLLRQQLAEAQHRTNELIANRCSADARLGFIDLTGALLGDDGKPRRELYRMDRLHLNDQGYRAWTVALKPRLQREWAQIEALTRSGESGTAGAVSANAGPPEAQAEPS